ncbi:unnamed protein product [Bursaphelenchus okinawaensis]|uniref:Uncharacterized protein n=1 Tax=Bursaphelenchus okinawaensis TaxID=465554 RepID=A0A811JX84_9BILA|nr:unnamed protein product [Bursaphelenchus okinawaensis]CAG9086742.1 unnamed protein product [Bursaphelenchus okinawaensis]
MNSVEPDTKKECRSIGRKVEFSDDVKIRQIEYTSDSDTDSDPPKAKRYRGLKRPFATKSLVDCSSSDDEREEDDVFVKKVETSDQGTITDPVIILYGQEQRPYMETMPIGNGKFYKMTHFGHQFTLILCGKYPMPVTEWYDCIQISETLSVDSTFDLIVKLLPYQRAETLVLIPNGRWLDHKMPYYGPPNSVFERLQHLRRQCLEVYQGENYPTQFMVLGLPRRPYESFKAFHEFCRLLENKYYDTMPLFETINQNQIQLDYPLYEINDYFAACVLHNTMVQIRASIERVVRVDRSLCYKSPLSSKRFKAGI